MFRAAAIVLTILLSGCSHLPFATAQAAGLVQAAGVEGANDAVKKGILAGSTPKTIFDVRQKLLGFGGKFKTHIVANRGHENPKEGSFSWFETYTGPIPGGTVKDGELYIGFFSERQGDTLQVMQGFEPGLMIEIIAWDATKQQYDFWELIGTGKGSEWHFRGDSNDVLADVAAINTKDAHPAFGTRLRCSGCHTQGGPIMKELAAPNNDWWTDAHRLELADMKLKAGTNAQDPANVAAALFHGAKDASDLAGDVKLGINKLMDARDRRGGDGQSVKQQLRPLFAPMEINLASDAKPFRERTAGSVELPSGFFVDERLAGGDLPAIKVPTGAYAGALAAAGSRFAPDEANTAETFHAFVVPVRSYIDNRAIDGLEARGLVDPELVADVLAVDFTNPLHSAARAGLIRYVPDHAHDAADLRAQLIAALGPAKGDPAARELLANLTDPARTAAAHRTRARAFAATAAKAAPEAIGDWLRMASQRRAEVKAAETSKNPRGQILEPGFRVIFPVDHLQPQPGALHLDETTARLAVRR
ncbi:MAG: mreB 1 [Cyanobacteria bacterium RYN_339]|nr:mreB 1 [Cyanobacteria bacterium RYN_339]